MILFALADEESLRGKGLGVTDLAALIGRDKSQTSRSLKVLAEYGVVDRNPTTLEYRIGPRLVALAGQSSRRRLLDSGAAALRELVRELRETAHLSVLQGREVMTVLSEAPERTVLAAGWIGRTVPVFCTSSGRALLFDHDRDQVAVLLGDVLFECDGPNGPASVDELRERTDAARARGYAVVDEEFEPGLVAVGAPVRDFGGRIVAALNVSAPKFRFGNRLTAAGPVVKRVADALSADLGFDVPGLGTKAGAAP